jgi:hypothetical protein
MFTQPNYSSIAQDWDKDTILDCCKQNNPDKPCTDCCNDSWQTELNKVIPAYNAIVELTAQLQNKFDFITSRRDRYKTWLDELNKIELAARDICYQLNLIAVQSDRIWYNTCEAGKAIDILFCMIRDIYMQVDEIKTMFDSLQNCITRNNDPALGKGQGILKYLDDYKSKLDATVKTRDDIIKNIVTAVQLASLLRNGISTSQCPKDGDTPYDPCAPDKTSCTSLKDQAYYGFKAVICEWYTEFACDTPCTDTPENCPPPSAKGQTQQGGASPATNSPMECEFTPVFDFPICNNSFKADVKSWVDSDTATLVTLVQQLNDAKMKQQSLLACKNSLDLAIKSVDPAARC